MHIVNEYTSFLSFRYNQYLKLILNCYLLNQEIPFTLLTLREFEIGTQKIYCPSNPLLHPPHKSLHLSRLIF